MVQKIGLVNISGSNEAAQRHNLFLLPYLFPQQFTVTLEDGRKITVDRARNPAVGTEKMPEARWLRENTTAYLRIPSLENPLLEEKAVAYVTQFQKAKTLIIDVRNNAGGLIPRQLTKTLMDRSYHTWEESTPVHIGLFDFYNEIYKGPFPKDMSDYERGQTSAFADFFGRSQLDWGGDLILPE